MTTIAGVAMKAKATFDRNIDTLVAAFLIRNPDVKPEDVSLVMVSERGGLRFFIQPKELHVPPVAGEYEWQKHMDLEDFGCLGRTDAFNIGWNACREAVIAMAAKAQPADANIVALSGVLDG